MRFVNLHSHSHYSSLDAVVKIDDAVEYCVENKIPAFCLTEHGTLASSYKLWHECTDNGIKPILGIEAYYVDDFDRDEALVPSCYSHIVLLCKNAKGWDNLKNLQSEAWRVGFYKKPRVDYKLLKKFSEGLICSTACTGGLLGSVYLGNKYYGVLEKPERLAIIRKRILRFKKTFGDDFYFEIMLNDLQEQALLNGFIIRQSKKYGIKTIVTNDTHYINKEDSNLHDILKCIAFKKLLSDEDNGTYATKELYFVRAKDLYVARERWHRYIPKEFLADCIANVEEVVNKIEPYSIKPKEIPLPIFSKGAKKILRKLCCDGISMCLVKKFTKEYADRMEYELSVINKLGMADYFLIVWDIAREARKRNIPFNTRGSVAGSLVAYLIGISWIDPIRFGTSFERFLTEDRISLPDIDMDFAKSRREELIGYLSKKYGADSIAHIVNFSEYKPKQAIKDVARVHNISFEMANKVTKLIPDNTEEWDEIPDNTVISAFFDKNPEVAEYAQEIIGISRHRGVHASGVVITPRNVLECVPVAWSLQGDDDKKVKVSEYDMYDLDDLNILKLDFLGQNTLDIIQHTVELIGGKWKTFDDLCRYMLKHLEDPKIYDNICSGNLIGTFQMGTSEGMRTLIKEMIPRNIFDICACISLYRTAILTVGAHRKYIDRRNGNESVRYLHPKMANALERTYGIILYQEQVSQLAVELAGFTKMESDNFRKGIKRKDSEIFIKFKEKFVDGCISESFIDKPTANDIWDEIIEWSGYGFNFCLVGDTEIFRSSKRDRNQRITIGHLYNTVNSLEYAKDHNCLALRKKLLANGYGEIQAVCGDNKIRPRKIKDIYHNGRQKVYKMVLENGMSATGTINHRWKVQGGGYISLSNLRIGDAICVDGGRANLKMYSKKKATGTCSGKYGSPQCGFQRGKDNPSYIDGNSIELKKTIRLKSSIVNCEDCGKIKKLEHHHKDGNERNSVCKNIAKLCSSCHKKADLRLGKRRIKWAYGRLVAWSKIASIEYVGEEDVFDVEMETFEHNFIANGIVSHNSHAAAYAFIAYMTAWLKVYYPEQFMTALLSFNTGDDDKLTVYLKEVSSLKIPVERPSINKSDKKFMYIDGKIVYPLTVIKNVGEKAIDSIINARDDGRFESIEDFYNRVEKRVVNVRVMQHLIFAGCFREFGKTNKVYNIFNDIRPKDKVSRTLYCLGCKYKYPLISKEGDENVSCPECGSENTITEHSLIKNKKFNLNYCKNLVYGFITDNPLKAYIGQFIDNDVVEMKEATEQEGSIVNIGGFVSGIRKHIDKNGNEMAFVALQDAENKYDLVIFSSIWEACKETMAKGNVYIFSVRVSAGKFLLNGLPMRLKLQSKGNKDANPE